MPHFKDFTSPFTARARQQGRLKNETEEKEPTPQEKPTPETPVRFDRGRLEELASKIKAAGETMKPPPPPAPPAEEPKKGGRPKDPKLEDYKQQVWEYVDTHPGCTRKEISEHTDASYNQAYVLLSALKDEGRVRTVKKRWETV